LTNLQPPYPSVLINQVKDREREENKRRDKRKDIPTLGSSSSFCWWSGSSSGRCVTDMLPQGTSSVVPNESVGVGRPWWSCKLPLQS